VKSTSYLGLFRSSSAELNYGKEPVYIDVCVRVGVFGGGLWTFDPKIRPPASLTKTRLSLRDSRPNFGAGKTLSSASFSTINQRKMFATLPSSLSTGKPAQTIQRGSLQVVGTFIFPVFDKPEYSETKTLDN